MSTGIDGKYTLEKVPAGENEIVFALYNYVEVKKKINVTANAETLLDVFMETDDLPIDEAHFPDESFRKYVSWRFDSNGDKFGRCIWR